MVKLIRFVTYRGNKQYSGFNANCCGCGSKLNNKSEIILVQTNAVNHHIGRYHKKCFKSCFLTVTNLIDEAESDVKQFRIDLLEFLNTNREEFAVDIL